MTKRRTDVACSDVSHRSLRAQHQAASLFINLTPMIPSGDSLREAGVRYLPTILTQSPRRASCQMPTEPAAKLGREQIRLLARRRMSVTLSAVQLRQAAEA